MVGALVALRHSLRSFLSAHREVLALRLGALGKQVIPVSATGLLCLRFYPGIPLSLKSAKFAPATIRRVWM